MSEDKNIRVIEINGIKMEIDLRTAKRIDNLKVGDRVKVLIKEYTSYKVHPGTIIGFEPFEKLPTIIIAYMETTYSSASVKFLYYNAKTEDTEVVRARTTTCLAWRKIASSTASTRISRPSAMRWWNWSARRLISSRTSRCIGRMLKESWRKWKQSFQQFSLLPLILKMGLTSDASYPGFIHPRCA
jgi:hypothetical protein